MIVTVTVLLFSQESTFWNSWYSTGTIVAMRTLLPETLLATSIETVFWLAANVSLFLLLPNRLFLAAPAGKEQRFSSAILPEGYNLPDLHIRKGNPFRRLIGTGI